VGPLSTPYEGTSDSRRPQLSGRLSNIEAESPPLDPFAVTGAGPPDTCPTPSGSFAPSFPLPRYERLDTTSATSPGLRRAYVYKLFFVVFHTFFFRTFLLKPFFECRAEARPFFIGFCFVASTNDEALNACPLVLPSPPFIRQKFTRPKPHPSSAAVLPFLSGFRSLLRVFPSGPWDVYERPFGFYASHVSPSRFPFDWFLFFRIYFFWPLIFRISPVFPQA